MKNVVVFVLVLLGYLIAKPMEHEWPMTIIKLMPITLLLAGIAFFTFHEKRYLYHGRLNFHFGYFAIFILVIIYSFSILNTNIDPEFVTLFSKTNRIVGLILFGYFIYLFINIIFKQNDFKQANKLLLLSIVLGPGLLILLNIILYALGINKTYVESEPHIQGATPGVLSSLLGFNFNREAFIFSEHPNNYAVVVGCTLLGLVIAFTNLSLSKSEKIMLIILIIASFFSLIILDSRSAFASTLVSITAVLVLKRIKSFSVLYILVLLAPFLPFIIKHLLVFISGFDFIESISRPGSVHDIVTANSRIYIWNVIMDRFSDFSLDEKLFFGYGEYGHVGSKDVNKWAWAFGSTVAHNFCYQILYDMGYLGVCAFMTVLFWMVNANIKLVKEQNAISMLYMGFVIYYLLSGIFESTFGLYYDMYTTIFFLFVFSNVNIVNEYIKHKKDKDETNNEIDHYFSKYQKNRVLAHKGLSGTLN